MTLTVGDALVALLLFCCFGSALLLFLAAIGDIVRNWHRPPREPPRTVTVPVTPAPPDPDDLEFHFVRGTPDSIDEWLAAYGIAINATHHRIGAEG